MWDGEEHSSNDCVNLKYYLTYRIITADLTTELFVASLTQM